MFLVFCSACILCLLNFDLGKCKDFCLGKVLLHSCILIKQCVCACVHVHMYARRHARMHTHTYKTLCTTLCTIISRMVWGVRGWSCFINVYIYIDNAEGKEVKKMKMLVNPPCTILCKSSGVGGWVGMSSILRFLTSWDNNVRLPLLL